MFRDFAIISTAFGVKRRAEKSRYGRRAGAGYLDGALFLSRSNCRLVFWLYRRHQHGDHWRGAVTFIVGPVTGAALGASSDVIALSIAAGVIKSIAVMILTPLVAKAAGLNSPAAAIVYGGLMEFHQWGRRGSGGHGPETRSLWRNDGNLLYRPWLSAGPFGPLSL